MANNNIIKTNISFNNAFEVFCALALKHNVGIAVWRLPQQKERHILLSATYESLENMDAVSTRAKGFLFHPYLKNKDNPANFLIADLIYNEEKQSIETSGKTQNDNLLLAIIKDLNNGILTSKQVCKNDHLNLKIYNEQEDKAGKKEFQALVNNAVETINSGELDKVVISIREIANLKKSFALQEAFNNMCKKYPAGFISFVYIPSTGAWMGVSPELFLNISADNVAQTVALAGTMNKSSDNNYNTSWRRKELEEHLFVSDYIGNCLKQAGVKETDKSGLLTHTAGELMHLKTEFKFVFNPDLHNLSSFLEALHPTPATCGVPFMAANDYILKNESFPRKYYCGYLGPIGLNNEVNLFVNLRCTEIFNNKIVFYAGAGITEQSLPDEEWNEVQLKCRTMYNVMASYLDVDKSELIFVQ